MQAAQIFFYISVGVAIWVVVIGVIIVLIEILQTIRAFKKIMLNVQSGIADLEAMKSGIKLGVLSLVGNLIGNRKGKGGEKK